MQYINGLLSRIISIQTRMEIRAAPVFVGDEHERMPTGRLSLSNIRLLAVRS